MDRITENLINIFYCITSKIVSTLYFSSIVNNLINFVSCPTSTNQGSSSGHLNDAIKGVTESIKEQIEFQNKLLKAMTKPDLVSLEKAGSVHEGLEILDGLQ